MIFHTPIRDACNLMCRLASDSLSGKPVSSTTIHGWKEYLQNAYWNERTSATDCDMILESLTSCGFVVGAPGGPEQYAETGYDMIGALLEARNEG